MYPPVSMGISLSGIIKRNLLPLYALSALLLSRLQSPVKYTMSKHVCDNISLFLLHFTVYINTLSLHFTPTLGSNHLNNIKLLTTIFVFLLFLMMV